MSSRYAPTRKALLFWTLFIGVGAVGGALCMLLDPSGHTLGMDAMLPYFQVLPFADVLFQNFTFSGWALLIVNGLTNLTAALLLLRRKPLGDILGGVFGVTLMLWISIQFYLFPLNFMSTAYFVSGGRRASRSPRPTTPTWAKTRSVSWSASPGWATPRRLPWRRRTAPVPASASSGPGSGRRGLSAFGGVAASGCTAGPCRWRTRAWTSGSSTM